MAAEGNRTVKSSESQGGRGGLKRNPRYAATRLLAIRPRSVAELRGRLLNKGFTYEAVEETIAEFKERGLLDDVAFARALVEGWLRRRAVGPRFLAAKLKRHRLVRSLVAGILLDMMPPERERVLAAEAARKHRELLRQRGIPKAKWRTRTIQHLLGRGFSPDVVTDVAGTFL